MTSRPRSRRSRSRCHRAAGWRTGEPVRAVAAGIARIALYPAAAIFLFLVNSKLSIGEGAMLAALPKGPSAYTPKRHHDRAVARRNLVLGLMHREGYLSAAACRMAVYV